MREILFRGKRVDNGEWVYGYMLMSEWNDSVYIVTQDECNYNAGGSYFDGCIEKVIPETVGQYTGLTDKNGNKIFEGDIVEIEHIFRTYSWQEIPETYKPRRSHSCKWDELGDKMHYKRNYAVEWKGKEVRFILRNGSDQHDLGQIYLTMHNGTIIGNIHDNPELLKGE